MEKAKTVKVELSESQLDILKESVSSYRNVLITGNLNGNVDPMNVGMNTDKTLNKGKLAGIDYMLAKLNETKEGFKKVEEENISETPTDEDDEETEDVDVEMG